MNSILIGLIAGYLLIVNIIAFAMMGIDKGRAKRGAWRISEKALFISALIGGSIGAICGMQFFRHKTKHLKFTLGLPAILAAQTLLALWLMRYLG